MSMDQKIQKLVKKSLSHLCQHQREEALDLLVVLGLKHYQLLYSNQSVHLPILEYLCGKYVDDLAKLPAGKRTPTTSENQHSTSTSLGNRQYRPDLMAHYPFADNSGSVTDVLHVVSSDLQKLLDMGEPACKRLVIKIFEEMRFSKVGLKMSDVPEALNRLGLSVSPALRKILERTDPDTYNRNISTHKKHVHSSYTESAFTASFLTQGQFYQVVKRLIYLHRCGKNPDDIVHLFGSSDEGFLPEDNPEGGTYTDQDCEEGEAESKNGHHKPIRSYPQNNHNDSFSEADVDDVLEQAHAQRTRMAQRRQQEHSSAQGSHPSTNKPEKRRTGSENEQFLRGLKHVSSKIAPVVSHDRRVHQQAVQRTTKAALRTVAQRRVDALVSTAVPVGFKDRNYFSEPHLFHSKPSVRSAALADAVLNKSAPTVTHPQYKRYADLGTGMATMEIADAFLQGQVGREILSSSESDYQSFPDPDPLDPASAQRTAAVLLGLPTHTGGDARFAPNAAYHNNHHNTYPVHPSNSANVSYHAYGSAAEANAAVTGTGARSVGTSAGDLHVSNYATSQADYNLRHFAQQQSQPQSQHHPQHQPASNTAEQAFGYRNVQDKRTEQKLNDSAKRLYEAPGWRSAQGGWVADFGPPHTHALYTGPEVNYASLVQDRAAVNRRLQAEKAAQDDRQGDLTSRLHSQLHQNDEHNDSVQRDTTTVTSTYRQQSHHHHSQQSANEHASSGAEHHVQRALDSASRHNAQLQAQYRAGTEEIDHMIKASHQDLTRSGAASTGGGVTSSFASSASAGKHTAQQSDAQYQEMHRTSTQTASNHLKNATVVTSMTTTGVAKSSFWDDTLGAEDDEGLYSIDTAVAGAGAGALRDMAQQARSIMHASAAPSATKNTDDVKNSEVRGQGAGIAGTVPSETFPDSDSSSDGFDYSHGAYAFGGEFGESSDDSAVDLNGSMSLSAAAKLT